MQLGCRNLTVGYDGKAILENINFSVEEGEYLSIVGENGSGKSTLMRTLLRLQQPLSGEVILGNGLNREEIGYLPQQTVIQKDFPASVREIVLSGCQNRCGLRPFYNREEKEYAYQMMEKMQIIHMGGFKEAYLRHCRNEFLNHKLYTHFFTKHKIGRAHV